MAGCEGGVGRVPGPHVLLPHHTDLQYLRFIPHYASHCFLLYSVCPDYRSAYDFIVNALVCVLCIISESGFEPVILDLGCGPSICNIISASRVSNR